MGLTYVNSSQERCVRVACALWPSRHRALLPEVPKFDHSEVEWEDWKRNTLTGANVPFSPTDPRQPHDAANPLTVSGRVLRHPPGRHLPMSAEVWFSAAASATMSESFQDCRGIDCVLAPTSRYKLFQDYSGIDFYLLHQPSGMNRSGLLHMMSGTTMLHFKSRMYCPVDLQSASQMCGIWVQALDFVCWFIFW